MSNSKRGSGGEDETAKPPHAITRRGFLQVVGLTSGLSGLELSGCAPVEGEHDELLSDAIKAPEFSLHVLRPRDLVVLRFDFVRLKLNTLGTAVVPKGSGDRFIVVNYPSQHFQERAFYENPDGPQIVAHPVDVRISGPSRVAFRLPDDFTSLDYNLKSLLELLTRLELSVSPNATPPEPGLIIVPILPPGLGGAGVTPSGTSSFEQLMRLRRGDRMLARSLGLAESERSALLIPPVLPPGGTKPGRPREPTLNETALEVPYRLFVSPSWYGAWAHSATEVVQGKRVELWHSRLGVRAPDGAVDERHPEFRTLRALWTRDSGFDKNDPRRPFFADNPFTPAPLLDSDRIQIVHNTSNFNPPKQPDFKPTPVDVNRLMLSALGAWMDVEGQWRHPTKNLEAWEHRATAGRDHYVKVVYQGYLYPWGHRASLVLVTERKLIKNAKGEGDEHVAYLWQRFFVVVREPLKVFADKAALRQAPFLKVGVRELVTPDLSATSAEIDAARSGTAPLLLKVDAEPFRFPFECEDRSGRIVRFNGAAVWMPSKTGVTASGTPDPTVDPKMVSEAAGVYTGAAPRAQFSGQRIAFADADRLDDTTYEVDYIDFTHVADGTGLLTPGIAPAVDNTALRVEAIRRLAGTNEPTELQYASAYLDHGFGAGNEGALLLEVKGAPTPLSFRKKSGETGGFLAPSLKISGLSRRVGPVGGAPGAIAANTVSPTDFFDGDQALIFGVFKLGDLLKTAGVDEAPRFVTQALDSIEELLATLETLKRLPGEFEHQYELFVPPAEPAPAVLAEIAPLAGSISDAVAAGEVKDALDGIVLLRSTLETARDEIRKLKAEHASGLRVQLLKLFDQAISVFGHSAELETDLEAFLKAADLAKNLTVRLEWRPPIKGILGIFEPRNERGLLLSVEARAKDLPGKPAGVDLVASLEEFDIVLIPPLTCLVLEFQRLQYKVTSNKKPEIDVVFKNIRFDGVLSFVEHLRSVVPIDGFSDPPNVDVSAEGIRAGFTLPIPNVSVGMFVLQNVSLGASFNIPFVGPPLTLSLLFCKREQPFTLTVSGIGGGGFFGVTLSPKTVVVLEAALEFGACVALDFAVASGTVCVMAGIYFRMEERKTVLPELPDPDKKDCRQSGYLRIRGEVDVLGLVTASIELRMELEYEFSSHKIVGRAMCEVEVSVLCFSRKVKIQVERKFAGQNEDPTFAELMAPEGEYKPWNEYVSAFAA